MATNPISTQGTAPSTTQSSALSALSGDANMFLRLLTTQMQNQDPLNPMDTSQYTQQLVQFSQVEQSIRQTDTLQQILGRLSSNDMVTATSLIGRRAAYSGVMAGLTSGGAAHWQWRTDRAPASLTATISDETGRIVEKRTLAPDVEALDWDGLLNDGSSAAPGSYSLALDARDASGNGIPTHISAVGTVQAVTQGNAGLVLTIGDVAVPLNNVSNFAGTAGGN